MAGNGSLQNAPRGFVGGLAAVGGLRPEKGSEAGVGAAWTRLPVSAFP
jgi:hypothetical protein